MTQATQPKVEWGFYAVTPRIVRTQYKDLSHAEKWLYVCLKDLCGEKGMCYRTLRSLSEETNISIASLSSMIPELQKVGLIHAEKKKRSNSGKEIWHISIVDIWQANHEYCSKNEQSSEVVQNLNNVVQNLNDNSQDCSENERVCSDFPYRRITIEEETITEERTREEREDVAPATARSQSSPQPNIKFVDDEETEKRGIVNLFTWNLVPMLTPLQVLNLDTEKLPIIPPSQKESANGYTHQRPIVDSNSAAHSHQPEPLQPEPRQKPPDPVAVPKRPKQPVTMPISPEAQRILDDWVSLFTRKIVINQADIEAAEHLVPTNITREEMDQERRWLFSTDNPQKPWYRKIGVCLADINKKYSQWQSLNEAPKPQQAPANNAPRSAANMPAHLGNEPLTVWNPNKKKQSTLVKEH